MMSIQKLQQVTKGSFLRKSKKDTFIADLSIDSRKIINPDRTLFVAINGEQRSGVQFVKDAYLKGIRNFIVGEKTDLSFFADDVNIIWVTDPVAALQRIGTYIRHQYDYPVIAITGSNGKTIVKEWLSKILSGSEPYNLGGGIVKSPKSYNSQIGVPLSVWNMQADNTIGIFEAGISKVGEMEKLEQILTPDIGIFTNIGDAHSEFFTGKEEKLREKFRLFYAARILIISLDIDKILPEIRELKKKNKKLQLFTWSASDPEADVLIISKRIQRHHCKLQYRFRSRKYAITIPFTQEAYIQNAINVLCTLLYLDIPFAVIRDGMAQLKAVAMRLEVREAINNSFVIADTYNSDLSSLKVGLEFLSQQIRRKKTLILSDMQESGKDFQKLAREISKLLREYGIDKLIGIGSQMSRFRKIFDQDKNLETCFFESTDAFLGQYQPSFFDHEYILLKGARVFEFERIQNRLELKMHHTVLEVDLEAIAHNLKVYKKYIRRGTRIMAMVKAHSYGSGSLEIAQKLQYEGVDYLTVAYADEGIELRKGGISLPIMVMSPEIHSFESMIRWRMEPEIFNIHSLQLFIEAAMAHQEIHYPVHIKLDTGMHRLGFEEKDLEALLDILHHTETVKVASIFSHLAGSDDPAFDSFTENQNRIFERMSRKLEEGLHYHPVLHIANSAGIINHPGLHKDMVRLGIGLYGVDSSSRIQNKLSNVSTLKTYIVQIREVKKSETVGYGRRGRLKRDSRIATVAIGYADGYFRDFGNGVAYMLVRGGKAPIVGSICMDMCMLDVTDIDHVQEGDEVIVFGKDLPVTTLARWANTIGYEVLTGISRRVNRIYINE